MKTKLPGLFIVLVLLSATHLIPVQAVSLGIAQTNNQPMLFWPAVDANCVLQSTTNLAAPNWLTVSNAVQVTGSNNTVIVNNISTAIFFRLRANTPSGMTLIPAGSFTMGDTFNEGWSNELPLHAVYVSAFYMDTNLVPYSLWTNVYQWATNNGYTFDSAGSGKAANHPVQMIDWYDAVKWCNARSEQAGKMPAYYTSAAQTTVYRSGQVDVDNSSVNWNVGYRLPTEAEWEKAARGGASGQRFPWGNTISWSQANYCAYASGYAYDVNLTNGYDTNFTSGGAPYTSPVGSFAPNGYGLYDMAGNVWQWCWDWYGDYSSAPQTDPCGPTAGQYGPLRVFRGGSWNYVPFFSRSSFRFYYHLPNFSYYYFGFRSVLAPGQ